MTDIRTDAQNVTLCSRPMTILLRGILYTGTVRFIAQDYL